MRTRKKAVSLQCNWEIAISLKGKKRKFKVLNKNFNRQIEVKDLKRITIIGSWSFLGKEKISIQEKRGNKKEKPIGFSYGRRGILKKEFARFFYFLIIPVHPIVFRSFSYEFSGKIAHLILTLLIRFPAYCFSFHRRLISCL